MKTIALLISLWLVCNTTFARPNILVINSYDLSYPWAAQIQRGISAGLSTLPSVHEISYEFMDGRRYGSPKYLKRFMAGFKKKYQNKHFDYVLVTDDMAFSFYMKNYKTLFPHAPLFFGGLLSIDQKILDRHPTPIRGILEKYDFNKSLKLACQLHKTKKIYFLMDAEWKKAAYTKLMQAFKRDLPDLEVVPIALEDLTQEELLEEIEKWDNGLIFMNPLAKDKRGNVMDIILQARKVAALAKLPIFVDSSIFLGTGVVGGMVVDGTMYGKNIALKLVRYIEGHDDAPAIIHQPKDLFIYDYRALTRFNIPISSLPAGSRLLYKSRSLYHEYKEYIWITAFLLIFLIIVAVFQFFLKKKLKSLISLKTTELNEQFKKQKRLRKSLAAQEKLAMIGSLSANIAHEIKNPLHIIVNSAQLIQKKMNQEGGPKNEEYIKKMLDHIVNHSHRANSTITSILVQTRTTPLKSDVNLNELINEALHLTFQSTLTEGKFQVEIVKDFDDLPLLKLSKENILRSLINILENSLYAMKAKTEEGYTPLLKLTTKKTSDSIIIEINDNGVGISSEIIDKIATPFFTTKPIGAGTGLGLSIVSEIISAHGGDVEIQSQITKYSTIKIVLPIENIIAFDLEA